MGREAAIASRRKNWIVHEARRAAYIAGEADAPSQVLLPDVGEKAGAAGPPREGSQSEKAQRHVPKSLGGFSVQWNGSRAFCCR